MIVIRDLGGCPSPTDGCAVTIGAYDGVHRGHQAVIAHVRGLAAERGLATALVTFDRHPASVVRPESAPSLLTDLDQKLELLDTLELDYALVVPFDEQRAAEPAEDFVTEVLVECLRARLVVVGADFHFGHRRRGNVALLRSMGDEHGFDVVGLDLVDAHGDAAASSQQVSSTAVRALLAEGDVEVAAELLGRPHEVRGVVEPGDRRGRELGFPTANVAVPADIQVPGDGIYAGWYLRPGGDRHGAAISLGRRPTFYENADKSLLEAHVLDFDADLYGERARVQFVARLRGEERFATVEDLVAQIHRDCAAARAVLAV